MYVSFELMTSISAELSLNKARGNIRPRPQACRATNQNLGSSHRVALNEHCRHCCLVVNCHNYYMHIQATAQKTSIDSNYNRYENKSRPKQSYMRAYYQNTSTQVSVKRRTPTFFELSPWRNYRSAL